ncbi:PREDICTED: nuclear transcription factor Y subunit B-8-like [Fragaria vesca subsp. vesca]|uniref:nuclear transcription factor Y subunit B-8-like n=1 Tax=Fragaria vesca subsp. vesca TaxID=101020 RepID=UPI0002C3726C|nr:PREDICTED: nuclear transcription factor Y subunit B-8-like [Fragaria vesca subsp. vesca]
MDPMNDLDRVCNNINNHEKSITASESDPNQVIDTNNPNEVNISRGNNVEVVSPRQPVQIVHEHNQYMPIANVIRIMRRILPLYAKISDDAKEIVQECVSEYISFITGEANEHCQQEQRKTVTAEDVLWAMGKLGFDDYIEPLSLFLTKYREAEGINRNSFFMKRERGDGRRKENAMRGHYRPLGLALAEQQPGVYEPGAMSGSYRDGEEGGSGSGGVGPISPFLSQGQGESFVGGGLDPFAQFKLQE